MESLKQSSKFQKEAASEFALGVVLSDPQAQRIEVWLPEPIKDESPCVSLRIETPDGQTSQELGLFEPIGSDRLRFRWPDELPRQWWSVKQPQLYRLSGSIEYGPHALTVDLTFGLRWWSTCEGHIQLNGRPFYARGCIRGISAHDHPNLTGLPDHAADEKNIRAAKAFGFNYIRWHSTIPSEAYLDAADRLGLAIQIELGFEYRDGTFHFDHQRWERTIRRVSRHPSVAVYCLGNEIRGAGKIAEIQALAEQAKKWDPAPLVMDNCGWGQPDRPTPDVYAQHVAYFFPYGEHADMFDRVQGFDLEGFCQTPPPSPQEPGSVENPLRPVMAHEVCHYIAMRDLDTLEQKWRRWKLLAQADAQPPPVTLPGWLEDLRKLYNQKGLAEDEPALRHASQYFQALAQKHVLESIRLSPALHGYQMLQLSDCWKYENSNGLLDAFDDPIHWNPDEFARFNADSVLLVRFGSERSYAAGKPVTLPLFVSHYGDTALASAEIQVVVRIDGRVAAEAEPRTTSPLEAGQLHPLGNATVMTPAVDRACEAELCVTLGSLENRWPIWILPTETSENPDTDDPRVIRELTPETLAAVAAGEHRLWLYQPRYLFDAKQPRPALDWVGRRDLMKAAIWDRGDNLGAVIRDHPALGDLPHNGCADWQLAPLFHHGAKINLDSFPVPIRPIVQGVGRPVRDRMEVKKFGKSDFVPEHTCRRWGWLFELEIGRGRLLVCGLNVETPCVAGTHLLNQMLRYLDEPCAEPSAAIAPDCLELYLTRLSQSPVHPEPPMTEYWLRDNAPVETTLFWQELGITLR